MKPTILECVMRDGSYAIDFQFTEQDTKLIVGALDAAGIEWIEVGHGVGLGASEKNKGNAAETDETYMRAASESVKKAKWGMFCIPGIAELNHIDMAADYGMNFIRIGTNVEDYEISRPFIERAKKFGMFVCSNFMKSYCSLPKEFANFAWEVERYGSDLVYIVDSAGGMFPEDVESYIYAIREKTKNLRLGFHGHNNLGLAVINSVTAARMGVEFIDTSLQGLGRSAGNTSTEQFMCAMVRCGIEIDVDPIKVMDIGEKYIQPLITSKGFDSVDIISGLAYFHSSYMNTIKEFATKYRVDPRRLIIAVCEKDRVNAPSQLVEEQAKRLSRLGVQGNWKALYKHYYGNEQD